MNKRHLSVILLAAMLTSTLAACGTPQQSTDDPTITSDTESDTTALEKSEFEPVNTKYGGADFIIAENDIGDWMQSAFVFEENADILNDAIYERNRTVEELYDIHISGYKINGGRNSQELSELTNSILAGDKEFDIAYIPGQLTSKIFNNPDYLIPLSDVSTLGLTHSWWDEGTVEAMTIRGKTISATGDMIVSTTGASTITLFNKTIAADNNIDMYKIVRDGGFTLDKAHELAKQVSKDIDGDTKYDPNKDRYGLCLESLNLGQFVMAAGEHMTTINSDGVPELALGTERVSEVVQTFIKVIDDRDCVVAAQDNRMTITGSPFAVIFDADNLFLWVTNLQRMKQAREYTAEFGLIPFPKFDESDEYVNPINEYWSSWVIIPATNDESERAGVIMEALGYYSQQLVTPAFIEKSVTTKALRDDDSAEMLEMILNKKVTDIGCYFDWGYWMLYGLASGHNANIASTLAQNKATIEASIENFVSAFE